MEFPQPDKNLLPTLYEHLDEMVEVVEETLREHFRVENRGGHEVIVFKEADRRDYLDAMYEEPKAMVPLFMKLTGLTRRVFGRVYGIEHIDGIKKWKQKDLRETEKGRTFAKAVHDLMPDELYLETVLFMFYKFWETDKRRSFRRDYEEVILERLQEVNYPAVKDETIPGKPDIAIPESPPYEVLGEVRAVDVDDFQKRAKNFRDEAESAKERFTGAKFVAVAKMPPHQLDRRREELREGLDTPNIDLVVFQDEMHLFFDRLATWGIEKTPRQTTLGE
jgi:hypothetical protein